MIPDHTIDQILERTNIVEVVGSYLPLKKAGRNFKTNCPFHYEKTPSFVVSADKQIFHCFGCGAGGNVIGFLMKYERMEFPEVTRMLAEKLGIEIPQSTFDRGEQSLNTRIIELNELASQFYHHILKNNKEASGAREYLTKRGINALAINNLRLGYAPSEWRKFFNYARSKGYSEELLKKAGLILPGKNSSSYDRFRQRIIFPIFDVRSRVVAFGGRIFGEGEPKYMNSPETPVYIKARHLYGLNLAKDEVGRQNTIIITEGYLDFITPFEAGIKNIVASLGTALTSEQAVLIKRYAEDVILVYDADNAGEKASLRGIEVLIVEGLTVKIVALPTGMDPDSFVRKNGKDKFKELVDSAVEFFDYQSKVLQTRYDIKTISGKHKFAREFLPTIAKIKNEVLKSSYLTRLSDVLGIDETSLRTEMGKIKDYPSQVRPAPVGHNAPIERALSAEKMILAIMLDNKDALSRIKGHIEVNDFTSPGCRRIAQELFEINNEGNKVNPARLINRFNGEGMPELLSEISSISDTVVDRDRALADCIKWIKNERRKSMINALRSEIKVAQESNDEDKVIRLVVECNKLLKVQE